MQINAYFDNVLVYDVDTILDVVTGTSFALELSETDVAVFANNDRVLDIEQSAGWVDIKALAVGTSTLRVMNGTEIVKDLIIRIVDEITRPATEIGTTFGQPEDKA